MKEIPPSDIVRQAVAEAVLHAMREAPNMTDKELSALAIKVARAIEAGFAVVTFVVPLDAPRT